MDTETVLADLAERFHEHQMGADPLSATYHGLTSHRDRLPDLSEEGTRAQRSDASALLADVRDLDPSALDHRQQTTHAMLFDLLEMEIDHLSNDWPEIGVDAFDYGPQTNLLFFLSRIELDDADAANDFMVRLSLIPEYFATALDRHRTGTAAGRTPTHRGVVAAIEQSRAAATADIDASLIMSPLRADGVASDVRQRAEPLWLDVVAPAFATYADGLATDIEPTARPDDRVGLCWLDGGESLYRTSLTAFTTIADPDPDAIHRIGLGVIDALRQEYAEIGGRFLGLTDLTDIRHRLHSDPALNYGSVEEIVTHAQAICDMAAARVGEVIGRLPSLPCVVKAIPEVEARGAASAFYQEPASHRPYGTYWVNTTDPVLPKAEAEATAFHEAAPGHHTQLALQHELDLPTFRRFGSVLSGYAEGWGLYTERLAVEMGMYSGDLALLGMLAADSMRACRLVIDTGIHHLGWSRQQAIDYMRDNTPLPEDSVRAEVDRYIVYPGQACSYMLGRLEIERLRRDAENQLRQAFSLRDFHDVVLGEGCVPLTVLGANVRRWAAQVAQ